MVRQSHPLALLTRPLLQSQRFAARIGNALISPLMAPEYLAPTIPPGIFTALVLTSETGVEAARRISAFGVSLPHQAFCVGEHTANVAREAGFEAHSAAGNGDDLLALITTFKPIGPLLLLQAEDSAADLRRRLILAGIETISAVTYRQKEQPLSKEAICTLQGDRPVILPVFSPRSAKLLATEILRVKATAPLWLAALSPAVEAAFIIPTAQRQVALRPNADAMVMVVTELRSRMMGS